MKGRKERRDKKVIDFKKNKKLVILLFYITYDIMPVGKE